jgi:hypothetical protein
MEFPRNEVLPLVVYWKTYSVKMLVGLATKKLTHMC